MEIVFIAVFLATMYYLGLLKFVAAAFTVLLAAYLIAEMCAKKKVAKGTH